MHAKDVCKNVPSLCTVLVILFHALWLLLAAPKEQPDRRKKVRPKDSVAEALLRFSSPSLQPINHGCLCPHFNSYPNAKLKIIDFSQLLFKRYVLILKEHHT